MRAAQEAMEGKGSGKKQSAQRHARHRGCKKRRDVPEERHGRVSVGLDHGGQDCCWEKGLTVLVGGSRRCAATEKGETVFGQSAAQTVVRCATIKTERRRECPALRPTPGYEAFLSPSALRLPPMTEEIPPVT